MLPKLSSRGQESAPFELLVAVIIMVFVIMVGTYALGEMEKQTCKGKILGELQRIKLSIESISKGSGKETINISVPACLNADRLEFKLKEWDDPQICSDLCGGSQSLCTLLYFTAGRTIDRGPPEEVEWIWSHSECVKISINTTFETEASNCQDFGGETCSADVEDCDKDYQLVNFKNPFDPDNPHETTYPIPNGQYTFIGKFGASSAFPRICAYRKTT